MMNRFQTLLNFKNLRRYAPAGLALLTSTGRIFSGRSVESAAYNPTMSPLHAALVAAVGSNGLGGGGDRQGAGGEQEQGQGPEGVGWSDISAAVLVERRDAPVQYAGTVELILGTAVQVDPMEPNPC
jgi:cytidine deaminase